MYLFLKIIKIIFTKLKKIKHTYKRFDYFKDLEIFLENCFDDNQKNLTDICLHQLNFLKKNLK